MSELKPCPFCGAQDFGPEYSLDTQWQDRHVIECGDCGLQRRFEYSKQGVIDLWNDRPLEDEINARIKELEGYNLDLATESNDLNILVKELEDALNEISSLPSYRQDESWGIAVAAIKDES